MHFVSMLLINWLLYHMWWLWLVTLCDVTMTWPFCDYCHTFCDFVSITWYFPTLYLSNNLREKKRKRKEILNNNLAILPSHDIDLVNTTFHFWTIMDLTMTIGSLGFLLYSRKRSCYKLHLAISLSILQRFSRWWGSKGIWSRDKGDNKWK